MTVLEAVQRSKISYVMVKGAIKIAQEMISPSEEIIWAQMGLLHTKPISGELITDFKTLSSNSISGIFVVTDQRLIFVHSIIGKRTIKEIRLPSIRAIDSNASRFLECLRITSTVDMIITFAKPDYISLLRNAINEAIERLNAPTPSQAANDTDLHASDVEQLQSLKQLYDAGVITDEEFAAKKAQILNL